MNKIAVLGISAVGLLASGCIYVDGKHQGEWSDEHSSKVEPAILGAVIGAQTLRVIVPSNGCTEKSLLDVGVDKHHGKFYIHVNRVKQDYCKAYLPDGVEIEYSFKELGIPEDATVVVKNRLRG